MIVQLPVTVHPTRRCSNCAHDDPAEGCLQLVSMADGSPRPPGFACPDHQSGAEWQINLKRPRGPIVDFALESKP